MNWCWSWNSSRLAPSWEELTHWKWLWCWEGLGAGGKGDYRGWDSWMESPTWWTWVWVNSRRWWWTGRPGGLQFMGSQRVGHDWATEQNWTETLVEVMKIMMTSLQKIPCMYCYSPCPQACSRPPLTHSFTGDSQKPTESLLWGHCSFLLGPCAQGSVGPSKSLFPSPM